MTTQIYYPKKGLEDEINELKAQGVKVTSLNGEISKIEIDSDIHDIKNIENLLKLKFRLAD
jgi:hypothetical protein